MKKPDSSDPDTRRPRFTFDDWGWVVLSIGMGIGAGIAFAPIPVGMCGLWVFLAVALIGYPGIFVFQKLFVDVMGASQENLPYADFLTRTLGKLWGSLLALLYLLMLFIWFFVYTEAIVNDSASYLMSFGLAGTDLSNNILYVTPIIVALVLVAARGEKLLFKIGSFLSLAIIVIIFMIGAMMLPNWSLDNIAASPTPRVFARNGLWLLPFVLTSILFLQSLSPMVVWFRGNSESREAGLYRAKRAHFLAFTILFSVVFFYVLSFALSLTQEQCREAFNGNISALALLARIHEGVFPRVLDLLLEIFAVMTSFFSIYLSLRESLAGALMNLLKKSMPDRTVPTRMLNAAIAAILILLGVLIVVSNVPILLFTAICSPIFGIIGCLIPAWLVIRLPQMKKYRDLRLVFVIVLGIMLCLAPLADRLVRKQVAGEPATPPSELKQKGGQED